MYRECEECRVKIWALFTINFSPANVNATRKEIDPHLLKCSECRLYLKEMLEMKKGIRK